MTQPWNSHFHALKACCYEQGIMRPPGQVDIDRVFAELNMCRGIHQISKNVSGLGHFIPSAHVLAQKMIQATAHEGELQIEIDLHGYS